jgi:hypothetical protein
MRRKRFLSQLAIGALAVIVTGMPEAVAFKPFSHSQTGTSVWSDVTDNGRVTVNGREYEVAQPIVDALRAKPAFYNAGVIGPDGFPDLVFGQSVIHPEQTGKWLEHIFVKAWAAQTDPSYTVSQQQEILAFAYGFATHAAGDTWAHTLMNDFSDGVFPSVGGITSGAEDPLVAVRHIIVEGYIGDATVGYDGNPNRTEFAPGDFSNDSSTGVQFEVPTRFIYETLVNPNNPLPVGVCGDGLDDDDDNIADDGCPGGPGTVGDPEPQRGKLIDYFIDLRAKLQGAQEIARLDQAKVDCTTLDPDCFEETRIIQVSTVRGSQAFAFKTTRCDAAVFCAPDLGEGAESLLNAIELGYLSAWVDDIDAALREWAQLGLASTRALFDPATTRAFQNKECRNKVGSESDPNSQRSICEDNVGLTGVLLDSAFPFIRDYLISALGAPDAAGDVLGVIVDVSAFISDVVGPLFNPLIAPIANIVRVVEDYIKDLIIEQINDALQIDLEQLASFLKHPTYWLNVQSVTLNLPSGPVTANLFATDAHERLDALMGLPADHHVPGIVTLPGGQQVQATRLKDDAVFNPNTFAPYKNTIQLSKLLLLDAAGLNAVIKDELGTTVKPETNVSVYTNTAVRPANIMVDGIGNQSWLRSIDGDHGWRIDGKPRFCDQGSPGCSAPQARLAKLNGGNGTFPLWESCLARPAFRTLFTDWESTDFPEFNDFASGDPSVNPAVPSITVSGRSYSDGTNTYVGTDNKFTFGAISNVFNDDGITLKYEVTSGGVIVASGTTTAGSMYSIPAGSPDGEYTVTVLAEDSCHTFAPGDTLPDGGKTMQTVRYDATPPTITVTSPVPEGVIFDTDDLSTITYTVTDDGAGVDPTTVASTFDGAAAANGQTLDVFLLYPGTHTIVVSAADRVGNSGQSTRTFKVQATSASLLNNVGRACNEGLITKKGICNSMEAKLRNAVTRHDSAKHGPEGNILAAWINELQAQRGKAVDPDTADRFIAFARDLIQRAA